MPSTAHLFQDDDGRLYLYYVDLDGFKIVAQPLTKDGPTTAVIQPTEPWEQTRGQVTEGPVDAHAPGAVLPDVLRE